MKEPASPAGDTSGQCDGPGVVDRDDLIGKGDLELGIIEFKSNGPTVFAGKQEDNANNPLFSLCMFGKPDA